MNEPSRKPPSFYVLLTAIDEAVLAVRYTVGAEFPMEPVEGGGTYVYFPSQMICVQESIPEINDKIQRRLQAIQAAWHPDVADHTPELTDL
jgi:hypothetical protein